MKTRIFVVLIVLSLSGCTSVATLVAAENACDRENVYCGNDDLEERRTAIDIAEEAFKYDKKIYRKLTGRPANPPEEKDRAKDFTHCKGNEEKVCISTGEFQCI